jgi:phosphoserine phosphatase
MFIAVDFDECLIKSHLSMDFTKAFVERSNLSPPDYHSLSPDALTDLLNAYRGASFKELRTLSDILSKEAEWRGGARDFLSYCIENDDIELVILSSGLDIPIKSFLDQHDLFVPVNSCALSFADGHCTGIAQAVSADDKKTIIENAVFRHGYENVFSIGHSNGDFPMMSTSRSICIPADNKKCEAISEYSADDFTGLLDWMKSMNEREAMRSA